MNLNFLGKILIVLGIFLIFSGIFLIFFKHIPFFGKFPGDIFIQKKNFSFYFPIVSCLVISLLVSILIFFLRRK